jgi:hypothetical protein
MVLTKVKKHTVANNELNLKGRNGLYCFLPYERLDDDNKAVFKCGMTTQEYASRIENYHTYYPMGIYLCFFITPPKTESVAEEKKLIRKMEKDLFFEIKEEGGKMMKFETRPKNDFSSEWFYTSFSELDDAFETVHKKYSGSKIERYHNKNINTQGDKNILSKKKKYVGEIVYFV